MKTLGVGRIYYGWVIVIACFVSALCLGEVFWSFGVFFNSLEEEFGWSRSLTSSSYTFMIVGYAIAAMVAGRLSDRHSARPLLLASALIAGPAIALCSRVQSPLHLQVLLFFAGLGAGVLLSVPTSTVQKWFHNRDRSGVALAVVMAGVGVGALLFAPLINWFIFTLGWRHAFVAAGVIFFGAVGTSALLVRPLPQTMVDRHDSSASASGRHPLIRNLIRTPQFVQITIILSVSVFAFQALTVHLVPFATDAGITAGVAAAALGLAGGFSVVGRMFCGALSERLGWRMSLALAEVGVGAALLLLTVVTRDWMLYGFVVLYGVAQGMRAVSVMGVMGRVFGMLTLGELIGITMAVAQFVGAVGPYAAGYLHDLLGSYSLVFTVLGAGLLLCALLALRVTAEPFEEAEDGASRIPGI